jgi:allantoate deiminase
MLAPADFGRRAEAMLDELAAISAEPDRLVRLYLTPEHRRAANLIAQWMREVGLYVFEDAVGNVRGRLGVPPYLILGSHIDTVIDAGRFDGPLGVVAAILAVEAAQRGGAVPGSGIEVIAFGDEEGSCFPTALSTSAAVAGQFDPRELSYKDPAGITLADALRAYGKDPGEIPAAAIPREQAAAFIEVHIEQGPVLETDGLPLGIVTAISGQTRFECALTGAAGHAGTVPMQLRRDALAGAAEITLAGEKIAHDFFADAMVATVGKFEVRPGAANVIPGIVRFTLDLRAASDPARASAIERFEREAQEIAARRGLILTLECTNRLETTPCDPALQDQLAAAVESVGAKPMRLPAGAGHDGLMMAKLCPIGMIFVRCKGGISHSPAEYASAEDMGLAVAALVRFIETFQPPR